MSEEKQANVQIKDEAKAENFQGIMLGVPTFGKISHTWVTSQLTMGMPIFTTMGYMFVLNKPVDVARNELAWHACNTSNSAFLFFRDDDTIAPRDALIKLFNRIDPKQKALPGNLGDMVVGGVVYSKTEPPVPMIYKEGVTAGYEDWGMSDLVECTAMGMGCTLIPVGVFKKMLPVIDHYRCVNHLCPVKWYKEYKEPGTCPHCKALLIPGWFKTVRDWNDEGEAAYLTEDSYFCLKAAKVGVKIYADTGVQCWHEDFDKNTRFGYHPQIGPCWERGGAIFYWPDAKNEKTKKRIYESKGNGLKDGKVKFNIGCGETRLEEFKKEGYYNIDLYTEGCDLKCDVKDISPAVYEWGQADEVRAHHVLEHLDRDFVLVAVRSWLKALKPGGVLDIEVPNFWWAIDNFKNQEENGLTGQAYHFPEAIIFGLQSHQGEFHKTALTKNKVKSIVRACKNLIGKHEIKIHQPVGYNQEVIELKMWKKNNVKPKVAKSRGRKVDVKPQRHRKSHSK